LTFKAGTDDLRESPVLPVIAALMGRGHTVRIYDPSLDIDSSVRHHMQHSRHAEDGVGILMQQLSDLMCDTPEDACAKADTIVVAHPDPAFREAIIRRRPEQRVVDLVRVFDRQEGWPEMRSAGMDDYLQKPASREAILEKLSKWTGKQAGTSLNILLVEDDPAYAGVTKTILIKAGHEVQVAVNGLDAVRSVHQSDFDAILMDVEMPVMDGMEAASRIRTMKGMKAATPIIALTGHAMPEKSRTYTGICW
jgi:CheY-like chemotaxis protein